MVQTTGDDRPADEERDDELAENLTDWYHSKRADYRRWCSLPLWPLRAAVDLAYDCEPDPLVLPTANAVSVARETDPPARQWQELQWAVVRLRRWGACPAAVKLFRQAEIAIRAGLLEPKRIVSVPLSDPDRPQGVIPPLYWLVPADFVRWVAQHIPELDPRFGAIAKAESDGPEVDAAHPATRASASSPEDRPALAECPSEDLACTQNTQDAAVNSHIGGLATEALPDAAPAGDTSCRGSSDSCLQPLEPDATTGTDSAVGGDRESQAPTRAPPCSMRKSGDAWIMTFDGRSVPPVRDLKGMLYIAKIIQSCPESVSCLHLVRLANPAAEPPRTTPAGPEDTQTYYVETDEGGSSEHPDRPLAPPMTPQEQEKYVADLQRERKRIERQLEAAAHQDRVDELRGQLAFLDTELKAQRSLKGAAGRVKDPHPKERKSVLKAINEAIDAMGEHCPELALHLRTSVKKGRNPRYCPDRPLRWEIILPD